MTGNIVQPYRAATSIDIAKNVSIVPVRNHQHKIVISECAPGCGVGMGLTTQLLSVLSYVVSGNELLLQFK